MCPEKSVEAFFLLLFQSITGHNGSHSGDRVLGMPTLNVYRATRHSHRIQSRVLHGVQFLKIMERVKMIVKIRKKIIHVSYHA